MIGNKITSQGTLFDGGRYHTMDEIMPGVWQPVNCRIFCSHPFFCRHLVLR